jgi:DNA-binding transcriptional MerR regulator
MDYFMTHLEARSGLKARTIRRYVSMGLVPPPRGHGLGAVYGDDALLRVIAIGRMSREGEGRDGIATRLNAMSRKEIRAFVERTEPAAEEAEPEVPLPATSVVDPAAVDAPLPGGDHFVMAPVLPGLSLFLRHDAAPVVKRIAAEILARYAADA